MATSVRAPDGRTWRIGLHWLPKPRWRSLRTSSRAKRKRDSRERVHWWDFLDFPFDIGDDFFAGLLVVLAVIAFVFFMIFIGGPLIIFLIESVWGISALVLGLLARVLFRRPWILTATSGEERRSWQIVGWRAARRAERRVVAAAKAGKEFPAGFPRRIA